LTNIQFENVTSGVVTIYNMNGQIQYNSKFEGEQIELDFSSFHQGLYLIKIYDEKSDEYGMSKFLKN
jgi:hypothetical protein